MLQNTYFLAKIGADTAKNEQHFAKSLQKTDNYPTGRSIVEVGPGAGPDADAAGRVRDLFKLP